MPKVKSHSGAKKRFKVTGSGKVLCGKAGKRHLNTGKPTGRKRNLRGTEAVAVADAVRVKRMLPYN